MRACVPLLATTALFVALSASVAAFPVTVRVSAADPVGALPPIWRFFGADEPNYGTTADGEELLTKLGSLRSGQVYFRAHNLMTTGAVKLRARSWRVDRESGDAFTAWKAMGSPANPSRFQVDQLVSASHMAVQRVLVPPVTNDGSVSLERRLPRQGVELVELTPGHPGRD
jgi:hypothetical protein